MVSIDVNLYVMFSFLIIRRELFHRVFDISSSYSFNIDPDNKNNYMMNPLEGLSCKQHFRVMVSCRSCDLIM